MTELDLITAVERAIRHAHDTAPAFRWRHDAAVAAVAAVAAHYRRSHEPYRPMVANSYREPQEAQP
jgi:hypothetical protein